MESIVEVEGLTRRFKRTVALDGVSLTVPRGGVFGLMGENGAGKTTLIHALLGFHPPSSGTARIFGKDVLRDAKEIRSLVGYMPENDSYIAGMTAVRFVAMMAELTGIPASAAL